MKHSKAFTNTAFAGLAALTLGLSFSSVAEAKPVLVQRGPNGAAFIVDSTKIPLGAKQLPGAGVHKTSQEKVSKESRPSKIITRGPNGAAVIVN